MAEPAAPMHLLDDALLAEWAGDPADDVNGPPPDYVLMARSEKASRALLRQLVEVGVLWKDVDGNWWRVPVRAAGGAVAYPLDPTSCALLDALEGREG